MVCGPNLNCRLFLWIKFYWTTATCIHSLMVYGWLLHYKGRVWITVKETIWPAKPKIFTMWPFTAVCWPPHYTILPQLIDPKFAVAAARTLSVSHAGVIVGIWYLKGTLRPEYRCGMHVAYPSISAQLRVVKKLSLQGTWLTSGWPIISIISIFRFIRNWR